jgi:putative phosphoesterase
MPHQPFVVGLISDTHGLLRPQVAGLFAGVNLIVHAGDVGSASVLTALREIAPVEAVSGNVDDRHDPILRLQRSIPVAGLTLHVSHGDELGRPTAEKLLARYDADIVVFGHTHRQVSVRDRLGRLAINPGAAGPKRFAIQPSVARLTIIDGHAEVEFLAIV